MPETSFQNILAPVDFSELSAHALRHAAALAGCAHGKLAVLYANTFSPPPYFTEGRVAEFKRQFQDVFAETAQVLRRFVSDTLGAAAEGVETLVVEGLPADAIQQTAARIGAGAIVMGTHGRSGWNRFTMGSVAEHVLRSSRIPVLTVRGGEAKQPLAIRNILCPVNDSPLARHALTVAADLAACFGATVTALHVRERNGEDAIPDLCAWLAQHQQPNCRLLELTRQGNAAEEIVSASAATGCDLLVLGAQHRKFFDSTVLGTTTVRVVRHAKCPVLTVMGQA